MDATTSAAPKPEDAVAFSRKPVKFRVPNGLAATSQQPCIRPVFEKDFIATKRGFKVTARD
jgi:hypothetical protein